VLLVDLKVGLYLRPRFQAPVGSGSARDCANVVENLRTNVARWINEVRHVVAWFSIDGRSCSLCVESSMARRHMVQFGCGCAYFEVR